jgi:hypothetical protein
MVARDRTLERLQPIPGLHIRPTGIESLVRVRAMTSKNLHTKTRNRLARQDALREYMQERGSVQYLFDIIEKIEKLDPNSETFQKVVDVRHKMLGKYLPELKATEITGEGGGDLQITVSDFKSA